MISFCETMNSQSAVSPLRATYPNLNGYSNDPSDIFSFERNQGVLARVDHFAAGVYSERRFLLKELNFYNAVLALPMKPGCFGFEADYFGFNEYRQTNLGLAYARSLGNKIDLGVQFNYSSVLVSGYGNSACMGFEIGSIFHLTDQLIAAVQLRNPVGGKFSKWQGEKLAAMYSAGFGYNPSDKFFIAMEAEKEEGQPVNMNVGLEYRVIPQLLLRSVISTADPSFHFGVGLGLGSFRLDLFGSYHQQLGVTPALSLMLPIGVRGKYATTKG